MESFSRTVTIEMDWWIYNKRTMKSTMIKMMKDFITMG